MNLEFYKHNDELLKILRGLRNYKLDKYRLLNNDEMMQNIVLGSKQMVIFIRCMYIIQDIQKVSDKLTTEQSLFTKLSDSLLGKESKNIVLEPLEFLLSREFVKFYFPYKVQY